ncbi:MAG: acyl-CoA synthase [Alphaproteobacteria bacterium PA4]|nr:MAG: acyl-CoA synthase [Alphaproteobacteria bacterium PA4]
MIDPIATGLVSAEYAATRPDAPAIIASSGNRSFAELHGNANRLAQALRGAGLVPGDAVALFSGNRAEFVEVLMATQRSGLRLTPINSHLTPGEAAFIIGDCQARAVLVEARLANGLAALLPETRLRLSFGGRVPGFGDYAGALAAACALAPPTPLPGTLMLYTSGTTGRPKGVWKPRAETVAPQHEGSIAGYAPGDVALCAGPAYHAAPLLFDIRWPLASGVPIVLLERFDARAVLAAIADHGVTHAHMVPIHFQRLLALPAAERQRHDLSSLRMVIHGAAPCPIPVKQAMIDWLGPILWEYYGASEGNSGLFITAEDWLRHPGSVGQRQGPRGAAGVSVVRDAAGRDLPDGEEGLIYLPASPENPFEYWNDPEKTEKARLGRHYTLGDIGRYDADGWLTLTGRSAEVIISGGVNIYPAEIDAALASHPAVADACAIGAPDTDWGEAVVAVIELKPGQTGDAALAAAVLAHVRGQLAGFKLPKRVEFVPHLPRLASGKVPRATVRAGYWRGRESGI